MKWKNLMTDAPAEAATILIRQGDNYKVGHYTPDATGQWHIWSAGFLMLPESVNDQTLYIDIEEIEET